MQSLLDTLTSFNIYLTNEDDTALHKCMSYYANNSTAFERDFNTIPINANQRIERSVQALLIGLNIPEYQWGRYLGSSLTFNKLIIELHEHNNKENLKLKLFNQLINDTRVRLREKNIALGFIIGDLVGFSVPIAVRDEGLTYFQKLFATTWFIPIISIVGVCGYKGYDLYNNLTNKKTSYSQKIQDSCFLLVSVTLKIAAYMLLIIKLAFCNVMDVLQEMATLMRIISEDNKKINSQTTDLSTLQKLTRDKMDYINHRNTALINMASAAVSVGIFAVWYFIPGILVVACVLIALGIVLLAQSQAKKYNEQILNTRLQHAFEELEKSHHSSDSTCGLSLLSQKGMFSAKSRATTEELIELTNYVAEDKLIYKNER